MPRHSPCALLSLIFCFRSLILSSSLFALCEQVFLKKLCFAVCFTLLPQDFKTFSLTLAFALLSKYHYLVFKVQMVGLGGLEPPTSRLSGVRSNLLSYRPYSSVCTDCGGDEENRTPDPLLARQVLSQLSYTPMG